MDKHNFKNLLRDSLLGECHRYVLDPGGNEALCCGLRYVKEVLQATPWTAGDGEECWPRVALVLKEYAKAKGCADDPDLVGPTVLNMRYSAEWYGSESALAGEVRTFMRQVGLQRFSMSGTTSFLGATIIVMLVTSLLVSRTRFRSVQQPVL